MSSGGQERVFSRLLNQADSGAGNQKHPGPRPHWRCRVGVQRECCFSAARSCQGLEEGVDDNDFTIIIIIYISEDVSVLLFLLYRAARRSRLQKKWRRILATFSAMYR